MSDPLLHMPPIRLCWFLLWDRRYGPQIQDHVARNGLHIDFDFARAIAFEARAELRRILRRHERHTAGGGS